MTKHIYNKSDYLWITGLALFYILLARLVFHVFSSANMVSIFWPPSGLAVAALLIGGRKYWLGVFLGAFVGSFIADSSIPVSLAIAIGDSLEALICVHILTHIAKFDSKLERVYDYLMLAIAGLLSVSVAALIGVSALVLSENLIKQEFLRNTLLWMQGDLLGILLVTPLLLVWRQLPQGWLKYWRAVETIACFGLGFLTACIISLGLFEKQIDGLVRSYWMFLFIIWAAVRFGRQGVLLVISVTSALAVIGAIERMGIFAGDFGEGGLFNAWVYILTLTITGITLSLVIEERKKKEALLSQSHTLLNKLSEQVPGVIYQFRLYPDGHFCFPFASEAIRDIYEVTPEQVREDALPVFAILHPDDYDGMLASIRESAKNLTKWKYEFRVVLPKQGIRWRMGESTPEKLEDGSVLWYGFISDITERKTTEGENNRLVHIIEKSLNEIYIFDAETLYFEYVNEAAQRNLGYSIDTLIQMTPLCIKREFDESSFRNVLIPLRSGEKDQHIFETIHSRADGTTYAVEVHLQYVDMITRQVFVAFILDITERKLAQEQSQRVSNLYKALSEVNQAIVRMEKQEELFPLVCRCAVEFGGMSMAWVGQLDESTSSVHPVAKYGSRLEYLDGIVISVNPTLPEGHGPVGTAMRENSSVVVNDFFASTITTPWQKKAADADWKSVAAFPISRGGKPFAALCVYHSQIDAFDGKAIELLEEMSTDITFALDNFDREIQRKAGEDSLLLAASIYATSSEAMMVVDTDNRIIAINPAFTLITGYSEEDVIGKSPNILKSDVHDEAFYKSMWHDVNATGKWQGEIWSRRKNGEIYPKWLVINTICDNDGSVVRRIALFNDISYKKASDELIWQHANLDLLTGLPNRRMFQDRVEQEIKKAHRTGLPLTLLFLDLDYFKEVNDTMGHAKGDLLLKEAAQRLTSCVRESDTVARFGGDEFTILLSELHDADSVDRVIQNILQAVSMPFQLLDELAYVSVSIGVTCYPNDGRDLDTLLKNADQAMYAAKAAGRNGFSYYTPAMQVTARLRMRLANDLRKALQDNQLWVAYQPIIELHSGRILKAEALVRWQHPKHGQVNPTEFISVAEHTGLINEIGEFVFQHAAQQTKRWQEIYNENFQVSVNVSPVQINDRSSKYKPWHRQLKKLGLAGKSMVVEITEGLLLEANASIKEKLLEFRDAGIQVAIDDFGTGYSSLSYLKKFNIDYIKIDQSFVRNLSHTSEDLALCEAMIVMAHKLGLKVIAEGVETKEQHSLLRGIGCDFAQGYVFSKPVAAEEFEKLLLKSQ